MDMLEKIFALQKNLNDEITSKRNLNMSRNDWLIKWCLAVFSETNEVLNELNWKQWTNDKPLSMLNIQEEIVDLLHFIVSMALTSGMTANDLFDGYVAKNEENHDRQEGKVAGRENYKVGD